MTNYNAPEYSGFETSAEILEAIEHLAGSDVLDHESDAYRLWEDGTLGTQTSDTYVERISTARVMALAWSLAPRDCTCLQWGSSRQRRGDTT